MITRLDEATEYIRPVDVKIFVEDNIPYLEYTGVIDRGNEKIKVHFPRIDLTFNVLEQIVENEYVYDKWDCPIGRVFTSNRILVGNDKISYTYEVVERTMTKKELENKLGYKVKIID